MIALADVEGQHVVVIGGGIVGLATAIPLRRQGYPVTVIERAPLERAASYGNGGVLASCAVIPVTTPGIARSAPRMLLDPDQPLFLRWRYLPTLLPWLHRYLAHANAADVARIAQALHGIIGDSLAEHQALAEGTPAARWIRPCDYLYAYPSRAAYAREATSWRLRAALGIAAYKVEGDAWRRLAPELAPTLGFGVRLPEHGMISDVPRYIANLRDHARALGVRWIETQAEDIAHEGGAVTGVRAGGGMVPCAAAVLAGGAWSKSMAARLGVNVPLESERGYHVELWNAEPMPRHPLMIAAGKFVMTPMQGRLRLAGVVEFGGLDAPPSSAPYRLLLRQAKRALPGLRYTRATEWQGHRPAPADSIPVVGPVPGIAGAYLAFGHHHVGLTGGAKTGRLLAQLITGLTPNQDMTAYAPARFAA